MNTLRELIAWLGEMTDDILDAERTEPVVLEIDWQIPLKPMLMMMPAQNREPSLIAISNELSRLKEENDKLRAQLIEQVARRSLETPVPVYQAQVVASQLNDAED